MPWFFGGAGGVDVSAAYVKCIILVCGWLVVAGFCCVFFGPGWVVVFVWVFVPFFCFVNAGVV